MKNLTIIFSIVTSLLITSCITIETNPDEDYVSRNKVQVEHHWNISNNGDYLHVWGFVSNYNRRDLDKVKIRIQVYKSYKGSPDLIEYVNVYNLSYLEEEEFNETIWIDGAMVDDVDVTVWTINQ